MESKKKFSLASALFFLFKCAFGSQSRTASKTRFPLVLLAPSLMFLLPAIPGPGLNALPVLLGEITIGLESYDGYQEGKAIISTDEQGDSLEILIAYKGFGLDTVSWTLSSEELSTLRAASNSAAWWRSRLLERNVSQEVLQDVAEIQSSILYRYRSGNYPFEAVSQSLRFVRQGKDYALLMLESSKGANTRNYEKKNLPIFTIHFIGDQLPGLRDMLSTENMNLTLQEFSTEKAAIEAIISSGPDSS